ncbi:MAG TPA: hypothetical protein VNE17_07490 [Nitrolancea sp.]|nr:hypothetical protein [Nitrolancea sp.]
MFYLRLAETREASLAPEADSHTRSHERGVRVPSVVHFEPFAESQQRAALSVRVHDLLRSIEAHRYS